MSRYLTEDQRAKFTKALKHCLYRIDMMAVQMKPMGNVFPVSTKEDGTIDAHVKGSWGDGHWVGLLWLAYEYTREEKYLNWALKWTEAIEHRKEDTWTHDLGFLLGLSHLKGFYITGRRDYKAAALTAAENYIKRMNPKIGIIQWHSTLDDEKDNFTSAVDAMMNIALMWWAFEETGDKRFYNVGFSEAAGVMRYFMREDGSTAHLVHYNPKDGKFIEWQAGQGYAPLSCWSRGLAWAVYGFAHAYLRTGHKPFQWSAVKTADYFLDSLPDDLVPYWDFNHPEIPDTWKDSSAASPAASGLFETALCMENSCLTEKYERKALAILESLTDRYTTEGTDHAGLLLHGAQYAPKGIRTDNCLIWGDYYYMEGLMRATGKWSVCPHY